MTRLVLFKIGRALLTMLGCVTLTFLVLRLAGDPLDVLLPDDLPLSAREEYRVLWGLDRPLVEQYFFYLWSVLRGDFGRSLVDNREAIGLIGERLGATLQLAGVVLTLGLVIGIPAGIVAAVRRGSFVDRFVIGVATVGYALPNFFLGILLIIVFALQLRWLPSSGYGAAAQIVMPAVTLGAAMAGKLARFVRTSVLDVLAQPYVRTAVGKRIGQAAVIVRHVLPNAAIPIVTFLGFEIGILIGGAVVTESVFGWPGIGRLLVVSVARRDLAVVQATVLLIAATMILANLIVDLAYGWLDPRVSGLAGAANDG